MPEIASGRIHPHLCPMTDLPALPIHDYRAGTMLSFVRDHRDAAQDLMQTVLRGLGPLGRVMPPVLPAADRLARRRMMAMRDPYRLEVRHIARLLGRPGSAFFNLSYEFGCTARVFETGGVPVLFRTLDWPFRGLGERARILRLTGSAGEWALVTWPGVVGCLQASAAGRFAAVLNQAPERGSRLGRLPAWVREKRRFLRAKGLPPAHLLRQVMETAPDFETARKMLRETHLAAPVIYTLAGTRPGEAVTIERTENAALEADAPAAANHFATPLEAAGRWRARGHDSAGRRRQALATAVPPALDNLPKPILNPLTRLAVTLDATGTIAAMGYDADRRVTSLTRLETVA